MIDIHHLTKRYGDVRAVDDISFGVEPGRVTGFLGPNGSGKSTTMRILLGLASPSGGWAHVTGVPYRDLAEPLRTIGSLLDATAVHPGRTATNHLLALAQSNRIAHRRVVDVLQITGIADVADRRVGTFSLGMKQRLGIAAALLGDPPVLVLDEPINGLDTDGIRWLRELLRRLAREGRTVFMSSHVMSEMELTADHVVVIGRGHLVADMPLQSFIDLHSQPIVTVRSGADELLIRELISCGATADRTGDGAWRVTGPDPAQVGETARRLGIAIHELRVTRGSLEEIYSSLTSDESEYVGIGR